MSRHWWPMPRKIIMVLMMSVSIFIVVLVMRGLTSTPEHPTLSDTLAFSATLKSSCPATITLSRWATQSGVSTIRLTNGGLGYIGNGLRQEGVFAPQPGWTLIMGGLSVSDQNEEDPLLDSWTTLAGRGRVKLMPGVRYWTMNAAWATPSNCTSVSTPLPSLSFAVPLLHAVDSPKFHNQRISCHFTMSALGTISGHCQSTPR